MGSCIRYVYTSRPTFTLDGTTLDREITSILGAAHRTNPDLGITGALTFSKTHFAQVLEGPAQAIHQLTTRIMDDPRHADVSIHGVTPLGQRDFADWSMAFVPHDVMEETIRRTAPELDLADPFSLSFAQLVPVLRSAIDAGDFVLRGDGASVPRRTTCC